MTVGHRLTSRILLFDEHDRLLLFLTRAPDTREVFRWITPGGGVDPGEDHATAAIRELFEETGMVIDDPGTAVFSEDFTVEWDDADHDTGHVEFYVQHTAAFEPSSANWTDDERVDVAASRWWTLEELDATSEAYEPRHLPQLVRDQLARAQAHHSTPGEPR
jgi:8-oxo-dGTP pyrophosphatase MutT (NUDIX family)